MRPWELLSERIDVNDLFAFGNDDSWFLVMRSGSASEVLGVLLLLW